MVVKVNDNGGNGGTEGQCGTLPQHLLPHSTLPHHILYHGTLCHSMYTYKLK